MTTPTRTELVLIRDKTYRPPKKPKKRCENCAYVLEHMKWCTVKSSQPKTIELNAVCDAWEARK